jgi:hypothetical protein
MVFGRVRVLSDKGGYRMRRAVGSRPYGRVGDRKNGESPASNFS